MIDITDMSQQELISLIEEIKEIIWSGDEDSVAELQDLLGKQDSWKEEY